MGEIPLALTRNHRLFARRFSVPVARLVIVGRANSRHDQDDEEWRVSDVVIDDDAGAATAPPPAE
jgi:hypothetical protein